MSLLPARRSGEVEFATLLNELVQVYCPWAGNALHLAIKLSDTAMVKLLLDNMAELHPFESHTPLSVAC